MNERNVVYSSRNEARTRVKMNEWRKTVGITLPQNLIERAKKRSLNISRISEQALTSILDYLEAPNDKRSSDFLNQRSVQKKVEWTGRDLNPGPPRCQRGDHTRLIYPPRSFSQKRTFSKRNGALFYVL